MRGALGVGVCLALTFGVVLTAGSCTKSIPTEEEAGVTCKEAGTGLGEGCPCTFTGMKACYEGPVGTAGKGECRSGKRTCDNGVQSKCDGQVTPQMETCNLKDDDCNGKVDDIASNEPIILQLDDAGFPEAGVQCFVNNKQGLCAAGVYGCDMKGMKGCVSILPERDPDSGFSGVQDEVCNGLDDDCNGIADDVQNGGMCTVDNKQGECAKGDYTCTNGVEGCKQVNFPKQELCNNKDDNCNGQIDDNAVCQFGICFQGQCFCPHVFSYDGSGFKYETTVGGVSLVGRKEHLEKGRNIEWAPMWARLDSGHITWAQTGEGTVRAKLAAAEDEIVYFDEARLAVVEHPRGYEILSSSSIEYKTFGQEDPKVFWAMRTSSFRTPISATWMGKTDASSLATYEEKAAPYDVKVDNFYELDFGAVKDASHAWIVIDGWKYKEDRGLTANMVDRRPHIEIFDGKQWKRALDISTPRGDKKAVAFDLSTVKWPEGRYHMRVFTGTHEGGNSMWYLDRVRLTEEAPSRPPVVHFALASADLKFTRPPSLRDKGNNAHPLWSVDDGQGELLPEHRTWGHFTRYGDVRDLLASPDDRMVVMRRGDAVEMRFDGVAKPTGDNELTLLLETDLLFKPRTWLGEKTGVRFTEEVDPMPFHGMGHYPPKKPFPSDPAHASYLEKWQTRVYERGDTRWGP